MQEEVFQGRKVGGKAHSVSVGGSRSLHTANAKSPNQMVSGKLYNYNLLKFLCDPFGVLRRGRRGNERR